MKEIIKKITVYEFKELDKNIQEKLIDEEIITLQEQYCELFLYEDMETKAKELLKKYFKKNAELTEIYYDLNYHQGSGAMIAFKLKYYNNILSVENYGYYMHQRSFRINGENNLTNKRLEQLFEKIVKMNNEFTNYGYYLIGSTATRESAIFNLEEFNFLKNGDIFTD